MFSCSFHSQGLILCLLVFLFLLVISSSFFSLSSFIFLPRVLGSCPKCHPQHDLFSVWAPPFSVPLGLVFPSCLKEHLKKKGEVLFSSVPAIQVQVCVSFAFYCSALCLHLMIYNFLSNCWVLHLFVLLPLSPFHT